MKGLFSKHHKHELAFLPAALEIMETPPSPVGRSIIWAIISLMLVTLGWACVGHIDIIVTAEGRVIPTGKVKLIQPFETGVVKSIAVHDGQHVDIGDLLIELDPTINEADVSNASHDLIQAKLDAARLQAVVNRTAFVIPADAPAEDGETARRLLQAQQTEQQAKLDNIDHQKEQKKAEVQENNATISKLEAAIPLIKHRLEIRQYLSDKGYGSKIEALEVQQQLVEQEHELQVQHHHRQQAEAEVAALTRQYAETQATYMHTNYDDLAKAQAKINSLSQEVVKAETKTQLQSLRASVSGTVQQLSIHTIGGVVTPAEQLLILVPDDAKLEIEANLQNKDVGFVHAGQAAEIKIEAFTFTRYGLLHGEVVDISHDVAANDTQRSPANNPGSAGQKPSEMDPQLNQPGYIAHVSLDRISIDTENGPQNLGPGMAVTVEIKTGRRRVIDYLLSPLKRYAHEGLRER